MKMTREWYRAMCADASAIWNSPESCVLGPPIADAKLLFLAFRVPRIPSTGGRSQAYAPDNGGTHVFSRVGSRDIGVVLGGTSFGQPSLKVKEDGISIYVL